MQKLKDVKTLTTVAMLLAIAIVLGFLKIPITELIELRFQFLPIAIGAMLFGPGIGGLLGALTDILAYLVKPTGAFFPGFTICAIVSGIIYGLFFYKKKISLPRLLAGALTEAIICELLLKSLCLMILYGNPFWVVLSARILKTAIMYPINVFLLFVILKPAKQLLPKALGTQTAAEE